MVPFLVHFHDILVVFQAFFEIEVCFVGIYDVIATASGSQRLGSLQTAAAAVGSSLFDGS